MFSTLNNLRDISLDLSAGTLVGYTESEIKENFRDRVELLMAKLNMTETDLMNKLREQYNGYRFGVDTGDGKVSEPIYNPFAINYIFKDLQFTDKWILSGSAAMLAKKLSSSGDRYEDYLTTSMSDLEEACQPDEMTTTSLMYYSGYSTINKVDTVGNKILLKIPNKSINKYLAKDYLKSKFSVSDIQLTDQSMKFLISEYSSKEQGVRTLIRTVETIVTRLNMLRIADESIMKDYKFYTEVSFPIKLNETIIRKLLVDIAVKEAETWKSMYN
jgi:hypothetical protein